MFGFLAALEPAEHLVDHAIGEQELEWIAHRKTAGRIERTDRNLAPVPGPAQ